MRNIIELLAFHDERKIPNWLYHGFVLTKVGETSQLVSELLNTKNESLCSLDKRIHYSELRSTSTTSSRTRTAVQWAELFRKKLYRNIWFYLFGIDLTNINYKLFQPQGRDFKIYNTFFELGLFSACRYFFDSTTDDIEILQVFSEKRNLGVSDPFLIHAPYRINRRETNVVVKNKQITQVASSLSREKIYPQYVYIINFVDVLIGSFSQVIDYTSRSKGCTEVAEKIFPICQRLVENPYNKNSRYYKRCALSFFPKKSILPSTIIRYGIKPPEEQFYPSRKLRLYQPECLSGFEKLAR